jgi:hypothetical protein
MKLYIASHDKRLAADVADQLRLLGHTIVSTWHDKVSLDDSDIPVRKDADALVLLTGPDGYSGTRFVEVVIVKTCNARVLVVGRYEDGEIANLPEIK